jgi:glycosyltransferase involved in cell wall biosynthesis
MKIILANYRYFISGGPERYLFNLQTQLRKREHEIIPFSIDYAYNHPTPYNKYFVSPIGEREQIYYDQHDKSPSTFMKTISRLFYSNEVEKAVCRLVEETSPDIAYVLHYLRKLSPSLLVGLKKKGLPVIVRLSDYMMLCPQAHFLRNDVSCTLCMPDKFFPSLRHKCVKGSQAASLLNLLATWYHHKKHFFDLIDSFVCTNQFMYSMMVKAGYSEKRLTCIPTFTDLDHFQPDPSGEKYDYFIYVGRITPIKGLHVLLEAMGKLSKSKLRSTQLKIVGTGDQEYLNQCKNIVLSLGLKQHVEFLGEISTDELPSLLNKALFSVIPSLWFENLPNSLLESYSCGTPVLASNIGSLAECVSEGKTGFLFEPRNVQDLTEKIEHCLSNSALLTNMGMLSRQEAETKYSPEKHIEALSQLFSTVA